MRLATAIATVLVFAILGFRVGAENYVFKNVADTTGPYLSFQSDHYQHAIGPSINNNGDVVFVAQLDTGGSGIFIGPNPTADTIVDTGGEFAGFDASPSINNIASISFRGTLDTGVKGIFAVPAGQSAVTIDQHGNFGAVSWINDNDVVAFVRPGSLSNSGIYTRTVVGGPVNTVLTSLDDGFHFTSDVSINNGGLIAFRAFNGGERIWLAKMDERGVAIDFANTTGAYGSLGWHSPSINDNEVVIFNSTLDLGGEGIFFGPNPSTDTLVDSNGPYTSFGDKIVGDLTVEPSLNNNNEVVFTARLDTGGYGIYTGPDPVLDSVVETGDVLFGDVVIFLTISREGLNNAGEIAFTYKLANGVSGVAVAIPVSADVVIDALGNLCGVVSGYDQHLFGVNSAKQAENRKNAICNALASTVNDVGGGHYPSAIDTLASLVERFDFDNKPKDWLVDSDEKLYVLDELLGLIEIIGHLE